VWARIVGWFGGVPRIDEAGLPTYEVWETRLDACVHVLGVLWTIASTCLLLTTNSNWRFCVYSASALFTFCASFAFNLVGVALQTLPELLREIDHAAIFVYIGGVYTVFATRLELAVVWSLCGLGILTKLVTQRMFEGTCFILYLLLGLAPLFSPLWHHLPPRSYNYLVAGISVLLFGLVAGYAVDYKGSTALWHVCVLASSAVFWAMAYDTARYGLG
jgi:channel protein (hemolysin III family)